MEGQYNCECFLKLVILLFFALLIAVLWKTHTLERKLDIDRNEHQSNNNVEVPDESSENESEEQHNVEVPDRSSENESEEQNNEVNIFPRYIGPGANNEKPTIPSDKNYLSLRNSSLKSDVNAYLSDIIGIKRILPDKRLDECKKIEYPNDLPKVSIIIIFRDEPVSSLLRTVYSIIETSPVELIHEVILVDDGSVNVDLKLAIDIHVANVEKLKLVKNEQPLGLMMARQRGIEAAVCEYFIVLDGHIEVTPGWLEPVIYRLVQQPNALLTSHIGYIDREFFTFSIGHHDLQFILFDQITLGEQWVKYSDSFRRARNGSVAPIEYGIVPGMMIAMRKNFFFKLGGFDTGMEIWGSEHMELSVKVWLCGGRVEMVPCSKIGHLYRMTPWQKMYPDAKYLWKNMLRFILVWMDGDLKNLALEVLLKGNLSQKIDPGDLKDRYRIKAENNCKPYQYYIDQLLRISNVFIPGKLLKKGIVFNQAVRACLDMATVEEHLKLITYPCSGHSNQFFILTENSNIRVDRAWLKAEPVRFQLTLSRDFKEWSTPEFQWSFEQNGSIKNFLTGWCLTADNSGKVTLEKCDESLFQKWDWPLNTQSVLHATGNE